MYILYITFPEHLAQGGLRTADSVVRNQNMWACSQTPKWTTCGPGGRAGWLVTGVPEQDTSP